MTTFIKAKLKKSDDQANIDKYRVAANITEYHILSKLIFRRIIIPKFIMTRQFQVKDECPNQYVLNGRKDFKVTIIELLRFLHFPNYIRNQQTKFDMDNYNIPKLIN